MGRGWGRWGVHVCQGSLLLELRRWVVASLIVVWWSLAVLGRSSVRMRLVELVVLSHRTRGTSWQGWTLPRAC